MGLISYPQDLFSIIIGTPTMFDAININMGLSIVYFIEDTVRSDPDSPL